jgi:hypothetical protein
MSLENVAKEKQMGKVKGKLSLFTVVSDVAAIANPQNIPNYKRSFNYFESDKALQRLLVELVRKSRRILHAAMRDRVRLNVRRSLDYLRNTEPLPSHSSLFCSSSRLHNADHEPTTMMKFLMGEHRSHRVPAAPKLNLCRFVSLRSMLVLPSSIHTFAMFNQPIA